MDAPAGEVFSGDEALLLAWVLDFLSFCATIESRKYRERVADILAEPLQLTIEVQDPREMVGILGTGDELLHVVQQAFDARIVARGGAIRVSGTAEQAQPAADVLQELLFLYRQGMPVTAHDVRYCIFMVRQGRADELHRMYAETLLTNHFGRQVKPRTLGQMAYVDLIRRCHITFGIGPAGTGKTYLAVALAVQALKHRLVERIILTRPAVEAGEKLGFLPGDLQDKVDPYLRPLYDALYDLLGSETVEKYLARGTIEIAPLAYMRGRTLGNAFIILDEAQNTTPEQMKMFLTRFGFGSKMVVTGDITQIDLPVGKRSGLRQAACILDDVPGIGVQYFTETDVVRHEIVAAIIRAYEKFQTAGAEAAKAAADEGSARGGTGETSAEAGDAEK